MTKKKIMKNATAIFMAAMLMMTGCSPGTGSTSAADNTGTITAQTSQAVSAGAVTSVTAIDTEFSSRDLDVGFDESTATKITLSENDTQVSGSGAAVSDSVVTISEEGTYILSGTLGDGQIVVNAADTAKIQIVLNNADIHNEDGSAVYIKQADKVFITLADGSTNTLTDGANYAVTEEESTLDGVIFSKADLTINGQGRLNVTGSYKHGIVSKDDLVITGGQINVTANGQGLYGKDCVKIKEGTFVLNTKGDGIQSDNTEDTSKGYIYICEGNFDITSETDGIQAETVLRIDGGTINLSTGGGSGNASTESSGWGNWGKETETETQTETTAVSAKGLKAGKELIINNGTMQIDSSDDSVHCNGDLTIAGGTITLNSGDDGIHADSAVIISDGMVTAAKSYEGIEGTSIDINGGVISVISSDDGLNAAGGNDSSSVNGRAGQNEFSADSEAYIRITGGELTVNASGDGVDSNGALYVDGGTTYVNGPANSGNGALDYNGKAEITGGTFIAVGSAGMAQGFQETSKQYSILCNFSSQLTAGKEIVVTNSEGKELTSFTPEKEYQSVLVSTPELTAGDICTITAGDQTEEVTLAAVSTSVGQQSQGQGGMGKGGRPQEDGTTGGTRAGARKGDMSGTPPTNTDGEPPTPPTDANGELPTPPTETETPAANQ